MLMDGKMRMIYCYCRSAAFYSVSPMNTHQKILKKYVRFLFKWKGDSVKYAIVLELSKQEKNQSTFNFIYQVFNLRCGQWWRRLAVHTSRLDSLGQPHRWQLQRWKDCLRSCKCGAACLWAWQLVWQLTCRGQPRAGRITKVTPPGGPGTKVRGNKKIWRPKRAECLKISKE